MRWKPSEQNTRDDAMRFNWIWTEYCSFLWFRLKIHAFQSPRDDAMRFFFTRDDAMRFREANHTGRCDAMDFGFRNARDDAMRWKSKNTRDDAMRWMLET